MGSVVWLDEYYLVFVLVVEIIAAIPHYRKVENCTTRLYHCPVTGLRDYLSPPEAVLRVCWIATRYKNRSFIDRAARRLGHHFIVRLHCKLTQRWFVPWLAGRLFATVGNRICMKTRVHPRHCLSGSLLPHCAMDEWYANAQPKSDSGVHDHRTGVVSPMPSQ
ncbi:hypothetical protein FRC14_005300 [Serendipita sp. 396]|nr:hypothetical protein FRC14_005300 [Serendipita sp. 396]